MKPYADTNFFTRFYLDLPESESISGLLHEAREDKADLLPVTWLHRVELCNALQFHIFQGAKSGNKRVTMEQAGTAWHTFQSEIGTRIDAVAISLDEVGEQAEQLAFHYTARHGFRTYDVLHVASALLLGCDTFWSFDTKASRLAKLEGLKTI